MDNDNKHINKYFTKWFQDNKFTVLEWPSQSPNLNDMGNIWGEQKRFVNEQGGLHTLLSYTE